MQKFFKWLGIVLVAISVLLGGIYIYLSHAYRLHAAVLDGDYEEVTRLVKEEKVNPDKTFLNKTPLIFIINNNDKIDLKMVDVLLSLGADVNHLTNGYTYLHFAAYQNDGKLAKLLIERGADVNKAGDNRRTPPLFIAVGFNKINVAKILLEQGADVNYKNKFGMTPLFSVSSEHNPEMFKLLIDHGADYNYYKNNWDRLRKQYPEQFGINEDEEDEEVF